jgi:hypothetical protein
MQLYFFLCSQEEELQLESDSDFIVFARICDEKITAVTNICGISFILLSGADVLKWVFYQFSIINFLFLEKFKIFKKLTVFNLKKFLTFLS